MFAAMKGEWLLPESLFLYGFSEEVAVVVRMSQMGSILSCFYELQEI